MWNADPEKNMNAGIWLHQHPVALLLQGNSTSGALPFQTLSLSDAQESVNSVYL